MIYCREGEVLAEIRLPGTELSMLLHPGVVDSALQAAIGFAAAARGTPPAGWSTARVGAHLTHPPAEQLPDRDQRLGLVV